MSPQTAEPYRVTDFRFGLDFKIDSAITSSLTVANEWGPIDSATWATAYEAAIARLRAAGYSTPNWYTVGSHGRHAATLRWPGTGLRYTASTGGGSPRQAVPPGAERVALVLRAGAFAAIPFELTLSESRQLTVSVGRAEKTISVAPFKVVRATLLCSGAHVRYSNVVVSAQ